MLSPLFDLQANVQRERPFYAITRKACKEPQNIPIHCKD